MEPLSVVGCALCSAGGAVEGQREGAQATGRQWTASSRPRHRDQTHCEVEEIGERAPSATQLSPGIHRGSST